MVRNSLSSRRSEEARQRRKRLDHERYLRERDKRLKRQHEYYITHIEQCKAAAKRCYLRKLGLFDGIHADKALFTDNLVRLTKIRTQKQGKWEK